MSAVEGSTEGAGAPKSTIVLADDYSLVAAARCTCCLRLRATLEELPRWGMSKDAIRYIRGHRPTVLILDLNMPGRSSLEAVPEAREVSPETEIVVLTMQSEPASSARQCRPGCVDTS